ncbi:MAG TPA: hypothetical protein VN666_21960 [Nitrospira sp.]|nr:hypothetical protein [Nitrospira sp.]
MIVNFVMLFHGRPTLLKQSLESIGDTSGIIFTLHGEDPQPEALTVARDFMRENDGCLSATGENRGTGLARNAAIDIASSVRGDFLYLSDDDVFFLRPDWLAVLTQMFEEVEQYGFAALGAYNHPYNGPVTIFPPVIDNKYMVGEVYALATQSMLLRWETFYRFGPFCQTPPGRVCQSEDVEFSNKIRAAGLKVGTMIPPLLANTGITNSCGDKIPGWELVKSQCPEGVICE